MQQQQQQPPPPATGEPQFGVNSFSISASSPRVHLLPDPQLAEAAFPISSRPPPPPSIDAATDAASSFEELDLAAGEEAERGGAPGNRWPRQETLALLKIRSEMDAAFREATFKGPLWEEVSRKLAELGYKRSAKKCKEKFENVHKYYKRTKDGRAGRQDGKTYRFFSQLEALHNSGGGGATMLTTAAATAPIPISFATTMAGPPPTSIQPLPVSAMPPSAVAVPSRAAPELGPQGVSSSAPAGGIGFSWNSSSSSSDSETEDEDTEDGGGSRESGRKRKRGGEGGGSRGRRRMMNFFEGLMKQVMERQEAMQQRFLEAIEKREQDRLIREEAWRRQEMARVSREQELLAQERAMAASRDSAVISYLQKISGQTTPLLPTTPAAAATMISTTPLAPEPSQTFLPPPPPPQPTPQPQKLQTPPKQKPATPQVQQHDAQRHKSSPTAAMQVVPISSEPATEGHGGGGGGGFELPSPSRWPKLEVHALIQLRSELETRYQEAGPKGPLWEEISIGMKRLGYNRSAKRCKEKWENINKYFKKVKDSNKQRPEDAKTCPYFHQLDALYRKKQLSNGFGSQQTQPAGNGENHTASSQPQQPPAEAQSKTNGGNSDAGGGGPTAARVQTSNGGHPPCFFEQGMKKSEDAVKDLMDSYDKMDEPDSENVDHEDVDDEDDEDDEEDDENSKMQYKIQFQSQNVSGAGPTNASTAAATATAGSFMAMVQ
ncbi:trihelix transcription factor GTL1-like isoform X1 [Canna indica]|uniref:Trihelix transcription factor GTL1-like isoform X1 n=1 Tax=Canna indica TaxID=4628 RepID=A0AAQ3KPA0_9LILI|nr:trihelix transcription factor GTL1-like isoform X1 [Canna indica]